MKGLIICFFLFFYLFLNAQKLEMYGDTIEINIDGIYNGSIQWQYSNDSLNWLDLENETNSLLKTINKEDSYYRIKFQKVGSCDWYSTIKFIPFDNSKKIYGVKIDMNKISENSIERILNAKNKNSFSEIEGVRNDKVDDFKDVYPYNKMRICNVKINDLGKSEITYDYESTFSRHLDTFVEIPLFYMKRYFEENYDIRLISQTQYDGFYPAPMFVEDGKILDKVYIAVYETSIDNNGTVHSVTGKLPLTEKKIFEYRDLYEKKGSGFSSLDLRTIMSIQHLYLIRFANKNSQTTIGGGWTNLRQPTFKIRNMGPRNEIVIDELEKDVDLFWFKYQSVCTVKKNVRDVSEYATLLEMKKNTPSKGLTTFIVDKTLDFDTTMYFGSSAQLTGWSDVLTHDTGRTKQKTINNDNQICSVRLFNIENLWGNVWEMIDGVYFKGLNPYLSFDIQQYKVESSYELINFICLEQFSNTAGNLGYISNLGIDKKYSWFSFPNLLGGLNVDGSNGYGDYYYQSNELKYNRYSVYGGGFDHFNRAGLFNFRNWNGISTTWYLYGSRMQYKPI